MCVLCVQKYTGTAFTPGEGEKALLGSHTGLNPSPGGLFGVLFLLHISEKTTTIITFYPDGKLSVTNLLFFIFIFFNGYSSQTFQTSPKLLSRSKGG